MHDQEGATAVMALEADGAEILDLTRTKAAPKAGRIGFWVDIGTEGYFANLRVTRRPG